MPHNASPSAYWDDFTVKTLARAGLAPGMRVLDLGCGAGDPALAAASLVGPGGEVVGVDRDAARIELAARRAAGAELTNVEFIASELRAFEPHGRFDAMTARFILMHLPDPVATLARLTPALAPGGIVVLIEIDWIAARSVPPVPFIEETLGLVRDTMQRAGIALDLGPRLWRIQRTLGLRKADVRIDARAEPAPAAAACAMLAETARGLLPMMEQFGIARASQLEDLDRRLQAALLDSQATLLPPQVAGATGRLPT